jgi:GNAT superfamily N-acetyltransferase
MEIRPALPADIPGIVSVLRESLGDARLPKSETSWRWKHLDNVFGPSYVLLAVDDGVIVGVRPFMRWRWQQGNNIIRSVRAVDTATLPRYQGRGVFSRLTNKLVEDCAADGVAFIFNTPNEKSMPGYLKLGWKGVGRLAISVRPLVPGRKSTDFDATYSLPLTYPEFGLNANTDQITTQRSPAYLQWRYSQNPFARYHYFNSDGCQVIFRLKTHRFGTELRICDLFGDASSAAVRDSLFRAARDSGSVFISCAREQLPVWTATGRWGPHVTIRELAGENLVNFNLWKPSIGDLELF